MIKTLTDHYAAYDLWANRRFVERLEEEPDEVLDRKAPSSFPSLRTTLLHIRDAENAWYCRLTSSPMQWPAESGNTIGSLLEYSDRFVGMVQGYKEEELLLERSYKDLRGNTHRQKAWQMIMHCLNHSTQHRGQLITQMRFLELEDIPANDLVVFQRSLATV